MLGALEEIDTSMVNFSREQQRRERLATSAASSARAAMIAKKRYEAGLDSFLDLLDSETRMRAAQDQLTISETQAAVDVIALYKAMGGGWDVVPTLAKEEEKPAVKSESIVEPSEPASADDE